MASKQQTTALFLSIVVTRTRRHTELTKKTEKPDAKIVLCQRTLSSVFRAVFFTQFNLGCSGPFLGILLKHRGENPSALSSCVCIYYVVLKKPVWKFVLGQGEKEGESEEAERDGQIFGRLRVPCAHTAFAS